MKANRAVQALAMMLLIAGASTSVAEDVGEMTASVDQATPAVAPDGEQNQETDTGSQDAPSACTTKVAKELTDEGISCFLELHAKKLKKPEFWEWRSIGGS